MPSDLPKLYLARHGDTAWTDSHQHTGRTDLPLNDRGSSIRLGAIDLRAQTQIRIVLWYL